MPTFWAGREGERERERERARERVSEREGEKSKAAQPFVAPFARAAQPLRCVRGRRVRERWAEERERERKREMKAVQPRCELRACGHCSYQHGGTAVGYCSAFPRFPVRLVPCVIRDSGAVCMCLSFLLTPQPFRPHRPRLHGVVVGQPVPGRGLLQSGLEQGRLLRAGV
jgi:hypothetical protein